MKGAGHGSLPVAITQLKMVMPAPVECMVVDPAFQLLGSSTASTIAK